MGNILDKFLDDGSFIPLAWKSTYVVRVKTGDKKNAGTDADVQIRLHDTSGDASPWITLDMKLKDDFERGDLNEFRVKNKELALGPLKSVEIRRNNAGRNPDWFVDVVDVEDKRTQMVYVFPIHRWLEAGKSLHIQHLDALLPQDDPHKEQREEELEAKKKIYEYARAGPGFPVQVKSLPADECFSDDYRYDLDKMKNKLKVSLLIIKILSGAGAFNSIESLENIYGRLGAVDRPKCMDHWREDAWFGAQRVMSCNPVLIRLCTEIPDKFGVTEEMVAPLLEGKSLADAMTAKKIYIVDLKAMVGVEGRDDLKVCQPLALFYVNKAGDILPLAIQLFQEKGPDNPVFLPSDDPNLWLLAKMWYNVGDSGYHQLLTHLAFTHLKAGSVAVCTHRNLSPSHPVFKLLAPHFLHLMAINDSALKKLISPGGSVDVMLAVGVKGLETFIQQGEVEGFRLNVGGHLLNDLKNRGVDDTDALPFYPYRDDALLIWHALWKYVEDTLAIYYENDDTMKGDTELQQWARELSASFEEGGIGLAGVPGNGKFSNKEELVEALTCIIFMCSARHGAANFSQYDDAAFTPNYPYHLLGDPPRNKDPKTDKDLIKAQPSKDVTLGIIALLKLLSTKGTNSLGNFEVKYLYDHRAQATATKLREELVMASKIIAERNKTRRYTYDILDPNYIPNSISI